MPTTDSAQPRPRRRLLAVVLGVVVALVALEVALQLAAFATWSAAGRGAGAAVAAERTALCIGDSFTFGLHATSPEYSYPSQAQRMADAAEPGAWSFVNCGIPGQSSRDVLLRLPGLLERHRPDVVYLLVGTNDYYFRPARLAAADLTATAPGFPLRWRTLRMLQLVFGGRADVPADEQRPFLGLWHSNLAEFEFLADGTFRFGDQDWRWQTVADGKLRLLMPNGDELPMEWHMDGVRLWVESKVFGTPYLLEPGPLPGPLVDVLRDHLGLAVAACRDAGSRCVLLDYPPEKYAVPGLNDALRASAKEHGVDLIDVEQHFDSLGKGEQIADYFVGDGHCSDLGYAEMGKLVAEHARQLPR